MHHTTSATPGGSGSCNDQQMGDPVDTRINDDPPEPQHHQRNAKIDAAYDAAYTQHPIDEPDLWGDLGSFREAAT